MFLGRLKKLVSRLLLQIVSDQKSLFLVSFLVGIFLAIVFQHKQNIYTDESLRDYRPTYDYDHARYKDWLRNQQGRTTLREDPDSSRYRTKNGSTLDEENTLRPGSEAEFLYQTVRVACIVFPKHPIHAITIRNTWGKHCNKLYFFNHQSGNSSVPIIYMKAKSSFGLLCDSLHHVASDFGLQLDWILVTTEDTFALPENLRYYVAPLNQSEPLYLGHAMRFWSQVYNWGDAGYAINKATLNRFLQHFDTKEKCAAGGKYFNNGDWYLGKHLAELGIHPIDTRDYAGKGRFNGYSFRKLLFPGAVSLFERYWKDSLFFSPDGPKCCSNFAVTFHGIVSESKMYQLEYLFYHLRPFPGGGVYGNSPAPPSVKAPHLTIEEELKQAELEKWFNAQLTTPKNMAELYKQLASDDDLKHEDDHHHHH